MTMPWLPPEQEASPLEDAISAVVRAALVPTAETGVPVADAQGWVRMKLCDDQEARIAIQIAEPAQRQFEARASLAYRFSGHATRAMEGHRVTGVAVLDLRSKAFLSCRIEIESVGQLS